MASEAKIGLRVLATVDRPAANVVKAFVGLPTGNVCDANGRQGAMHHTIKPLDPTWAFAGTAITVNARPVDNLIVYQAMKLAQPGDVLVITNDNSTSSAVIGDLVAGMAKNIGIAAIVTDGLVRDLDGLLKVGLPVFCRGLCPNGPWKDGPGEVNTLISCGGRSVQPGDIIVGDGDGVVVVAKEDAIAVAAALPGIADWEQGIADAVTAVMTLPDWVDDALAQKGIEVMDQ